MSEETPLPTPMGRPPQTGDYLGHFRLEEKLGEGAMGAVFKAIDTSLNKTVAIKILTRTENEEFVARFAREAQTVATLSHPNVIQVNFIGQQNGLYFLAMEFVEGRPLDAVVREKGVLDEIEALEYIRQAAEGLKHAQRRGVIHRDVKPANLMVTADGVLKVADFGLAKTVGDQAGVSLTGGPRVMGTPLYMSPEQAQAQRLDHRSDIYSLGATLYFLLAGRPPFDGEDSVAVMLHHVSSPLKPITIYNPNVSGEAHRILRRMMAKKLNERYQTYDELLLDIANYQQSPSTTADATRIAMGEQRRRPRVELKTVVSAPETPTGPPIPHPPIPKPKEQPTVSISVERSTAFWSSAVALAFFLGVFVGYKLPRGDLTAPARTDAAAPSPALEQPDFAPMSDFGLVCNTHLLRSAAAQDGPAENRDKNSVSLATTSLLQQLGVAGEGLPDDGRVSIPSNTARGFFQLQQSGGADALMLSAEGGAFPSSVRYDLPTAARRKYQRLALLFGSVAGEGILTVTAQFADGPPTMVELATTELAGAELARSAFMHPQPAAKTRWVTGENVVESEQQLLAHVLRLNADQPLVALSFGARSKREPQFTAGIFAVSLQPAARK